MVTKITNNSSEKVEFFVENIQNFLQKKVKYSPIKKVVNPGETIYSRAVTGDEQLEALLTKKGCTLEQVNRNLWIIVAGQSNAVGYDETPWDAQDVQSIPYAYFEALQGHGSYQNASCIPFINQGIDSFQNMQNVGSVGARTKSICYELAKRVIGYIPDDYELLISNYSMGMSYLTKGDVGTLNGSNIPSGSTKWNNNGKLTQAFGKRLRVHLETIQPLSKLLCIVWCQGEADGQAGVRKEDYETAFNTTIDTIQSLFEASDFDTNGKIANVDYKVNTKKLYDKDSDPENQSAFLLIDSRTFLASLDYRYYKVNSNIRDLTIKAGGTLPTKNSTLNDANIDNKKQYIYSKYDYQNQTISYKLVEGTKAAQLPIYLTLFNKDKYVGYICINWGKNAAIKTPAIVYKETKAKVKHSYPLWVVYPGPQKYWNTQGTFKQIIEWQKANFTNFVDLPEDLPTNDANATGTFAKTWQGWTGYGFTSSVKSSHYGQNAFRFIADKVAKQIFNAYLKDFKG